MIPRKSGVPMVPELAEPLAALHQRTWAQGGSTLSVEDKRQQQRFSGRRESGGSGKLVLSSLSQVVWDNWTQGNLMIPSDIRSDVPS